MKVAEKYKLGLVLKTFNFITINSAQNILNIDIKELICQQVFEFFLSRSYEPQGIMRYNSWLQAVHNLVEVFYIVKSKAMLLVSNGMKEFVFEIHIGNHILKHCKRRGKCCNYVRHKILSRIV